MQQDFKNQDERIRHDCKEKFTLWLEKPEIVFMISLIPPGNHQDTLKLLLRSAFESGSAFGQGAMLGTIAERMLKKGPLG